MLTNFESKQKTHLKASICFLIPLFNAKSRVKDKYSSTLCTFTTSLSPSGIKLIPSSKLNILELGEYWKLNPKSSICIFDPSFISNLNFSISFSSKIFCFSLTKSCNLSKNEPRSGSISIKSSILKISEYHESSTNEPPEIMDFELVSK